MNGPWSEGNAPNPYPNPKRKPNPNPNPNPNHNPSCALIRGEGDTVASKVRYNALVLRCGRGVRQVIRV